MTKPVVHHTESVGDRGQDWPAQTGSGKQGRPSFLVENCGIPSCNNSFVLQPSRISRIKKKICPCNCMCTMSARLYWDVQPSAERQCSPQGGGDDISPLAFAISGWLTIMPTSTHLPRRCSSPFTQDCTSWDHSDEQDTSPFRQRQLRGVEVSVACTLH